MYPAYMILHFDVKVKEIAKYFICKLIAAYSDLCVLIGPFLQTLQFFTYCRLSVLVVAF